MTFVFTIFYTGSSQLPPEKNGPHLKWQFPPKILMWFNVLKNDSLPHHPGEGGVNYCLKHFLIFQLCQSSVWVPEWLFLKPYWLLSAPSRCFLGLPFSWSSGMHSSVISKKPNGCSWVFKNIWCLMHLLRDICVSWKDFCF